MQVIDIKALNEDGPRGGSKNAGGKYEGNLHYVIENTYRKNVRNMPLHYVYENKAHRGSSPLYAR
jgi:hypothetical protein